MRQTVLIVLLLPVLLYDGALRAAGELRAAGGRQAGMAGATVGFADEWSAANNQAGCAWGRGISCGIYAENEFMIRELIRKSVYFSWSATEGAVSFTASHFGTSVYNEVRAGLSYSRMFGKKFSAALQLDYLRIGMMTETGSRNTANVEGGLMYKPIPNLTIGFHFANLLPVRVSKITGEKLPPELNLGFVYWISGNFLIAAEAEKSPAGPLRLRVGSEYQAADRFRVRAGLSTSPFVFTAGAGIRLGRLNIDIATGYRQMLGFSPSVSLQYTFAKKQN
jgi:hypothetical protein